MSSTWWLLSPASTEAWRKWHADGNAVALSAAERGLRGLRRHDTTLHNNSKKQFSETKQSTYFARNFGVRAAPMQHENMPANAISPPPDSATAPRGVHGAAAMHDASQPVAQPAGPPPPAGQHNSDAPLPPLVARAVPPSDALGRVRGGCSERGAVCWYLHSPSP